MINNDLIQSFWERALLAEPNDKFLISISEAKNILALVKSDIYNNIDLDFEPVKNKAEKLYNEFASLINDSWMKSKSKTPYTYKSFFSRYIKLDEELLCLYMESNTSDNTIEELSESITLLNESFIK